MTSRRDFLLDGALAAAGLRLPARSARGRSPVARAAFLDVRRPPDRVMAWTGSGGPRELAAAGGEWRGEGMTVTTRPVEDRLAVSLSSPGGPVERLHLRWNGALGPDLLLMGDAWERGYGDLEWRGFVPERAMPWYFAASDG
jgi:alpha-galactosidase